MGSLENYCTFLADAPSINTPVWKNEPIWRPNLYILCADMVSLE